MSDDERARLRNQQIGFVFQSFQLLHRATALTNVALPLVYRGAPARERDRARQRRRSRASGSRTARRTGRTSCRAASASAPRSRARSSTEPSLLLCDEPTGNLDSATTEDMMRLFHELHAEGNTILIVTHEPEIAARCPRTIHILDGRVVGALAEAA